MYSVVNALKAWHKTTSLQSSGLNSTFCSMTSSTTIPSFHVGSASEFATLEVLLFPICYPLWHPGFTNENSTTESVRWVYSKEVSILWRSVWITPSYYRLVYSTEHHMRPFGGIFQVKSIAFHLYESFQDIFFSYKIILAQKCIQTARSQ